MAHQLAVQTNGQCQPLLNCSNTAIGQQVHRAQPTIKVQKKLVQVKKVSASQVTLNVQQHGHTDYNKTLSKHLCPLPFGQIIKPLYFHKCLARCPVPKP